MELGPLLGLFLQSFLIKFTMLALNIFIFVIVYGRMIEIYLLTSLAPIPVATLSNRELGTMGQNYLRSLFAVGFQGMLILVCVAIYAVLIQGIATSGDPKATNKQFITVQTSGGNTFYIVIDYDKPTDEDAAPAHFATLRYVTALGPSSRRSAAAASTSDVRVI